MGSLGTGRLEMGSLGPAYRMPGVVYQSDEALRRYVAEGVLTQETLVSALRDVARRFPERPALSDLDGTLTHAELDALTDRAGAAFLRLGLVPLDRVIFQLANAKELVIGVVACLKAGLIPICTLAAHRSLEIGYLGRHAQARAHFVQGDDPKFDFVAFSREMRAEIPTLAHTIVAQGEAPEDDAQVSSLWRLIEAEDAREARARLEAVALDPFQVALFQLSGGTTGVPKIIPRFHNEYLYTIRTVTDFHGLDETAVGYTPSPMMHNAPMACIWGPPLFAGGEVVVSASLEADGLGPLFERRRPNWMIVPTPILLRLKATGWLDRIDFSGAKGFSAASGAAKLRSLVGGAATWPLFGMTEGLLCYCNASDSEDARDNTVGRPLSTYDEIKLLELENETEVPDGAIGELAVRGPCTIRGYYDAEERNRVAFTSDGFYRSGDLMRTRRIDGRTYLLFEGRSKDVVSRGGEKINCEEVERICVGHPAIAAISIVAMPDPAYGERACAFVIPTAGAMPVTCGELGRFLHARGMAKFKWPERIEIVEEFPVTSSGKLSKPRLRDLIVEKLKAENAPLEELA